MLARKDACKGKKLARVHWLIVRSSPHNPASPSENSRVLGEQRRKKFPRAALAYWSVKDRRHDLLQLLQRSMRGRVAALSTLKYKRMCASPFGFFRGAAPIMAYDLSLNKNTGIFSQLCARGHARSGDAQKVAGYIGSGTRFKAAISDFASAYVDQSTSDWKPLIKQRK